MDDEPTARTPLSNLAPTVLRIVRSITLLNDAEATMLPTIRDLQLAPPNPYFVYRPDQDADVQLPPYWILEYAAVSATVVAFGGPILLGPGQEPTDGRERLVRRRGEPGSLGGRERDQERWRGRQLGQGPRRHARRRRARRLEKR